MDGIARAEKAVRNLHDDAWSRRRYELADALCHPDFADSGLLACAAPEPGWP